MILKKTRYFVFFLYFINENVNNNIKGDRMEKKKNSIWMDSVELPSFKTLENDIETDIVVVGGGIAGILIAYKLSKEGKKVVVLEKNKIGMGITKNTTAFITSQQDVLYQERLKKDGYYHTKLYLEANQKAILDYQTLSESYDFDFEKLSSYLYSTKESKVIEEEAICLQNLGIDATLKEELALPFPIAKAVEFPNQAQMNPLKLIACLSKDLEIYENTTVTKIKKNDVIANTHCVKANAIIVTTHFPFINHLGLYYAKMYQKRSYVATIQTKDEINGIYTNLDEDDFYFRKYQDYLIIGGNDCQSGTSENHFKSIREFIATYYPDAEITNEWSNQDCISLDDKPYIGKYSGLRNNLYVATGFNLWGMTQAMVSANILTDLIMDRKNPYQNLFQPNRNMIHKQLFINLGTYVKNLVKPRKKTCTHLGSALVWNETEQTWECPCHGSRFNKEGEILDNPTKKELKNIPIHQTEAKRTE